MNCESVAPSHAKTIGTNFALKSFHAIINLVSELWNTIEFPLRILYFTPNFTDMLFYPVDPYSAAVFMLRPYLYQYITYSYVVNETPQITAGH